METRHNCRKDRGRFAGRSPRRVGRGFTLIELIVAMAVSMILMYGLATVLILLAQGTQDSIRFGEVTGRIDLIRRLNFDARTGDRIHFPESNGDSGFYNEGGEEGHTLTFRAIDYNPMTETSSYRYVLWQSARPSGSSDPFTVTRWVQPTTAASTAPATGSGAWTFSYGQHGIARFDVERISNRNFTIDLEAEQDGQVAHVQISITLRNAD